MYLSTIAKAYSVCLVCECVRKVEVVKGDTNEENEEEEEEEEAKHPDTGRFSSPNACSFLSTTVLSSLSRVLCRS